MQVEENLSSPFIAKLPFAKNSLFYAPMEGITDEAYRTFILDNYPDWDYVATDFLRISSVGNYSDKHMISHLGNNTYNTPKQRKTIYQILTSEQALTEYHVQRLNQLGIKWLDLNLGCPSKTVCKNKGGSFLLSDLEILKDIIKKIRSNFDAFFSCKIRVGYRDDSNFINVLKLLEDEGVQAITIHARTRDQLYKGTANWDYVKQAVKEVKIPIIGNGDIWTVDDIHRYYDYTNCHSVMLARSAMKTPWLAKYYKSNQTIDLKVRSIETEKFFREYNKIVQTLPIDEKYKSRRLKAVSRYSFEDFPDSDLFKKRFLLSQDPNQMLDILGELRNTYSQ